MSMIDDLIYNLEDAVADREKGITGWTAATREIERCRDELRAAIAALEPARVWMPNPAMKKTAE
jgi:hypothetical protein